MPPRVDLDGEWEFSPDGYQWGVIRVPGCWEAQGYPASLEGPVLYRRRFMAPPAEQAQRATLHFGAVSYACRVRLNGQEVGRHEGLWDAFSVDVSPWLRPGRENLLLVEVTRPGQRFPWRESLCGFLPEIAMPFGGLWQSVELRFHEAITLEQLYVRATLRGPAEARLVVQNAAGAPLASELEGEVLDPAGRVAARAGVHLEAAPGQTACRLPFFLREPWPWEPGAPNRYRLRLRCRHHGRTVATGERVFGVRELRARGRQLWLNGRPVLLRGVLHWGFYPRTIAPLPSEEETRAELRGLQDLGFNLVKHCLFVPPEQYQELADELGVLLWQEWPLWPPTVTATQRRRALEQLPRLVRQRRGHPSLLVHTIGCELDESADADFLRRLFHQVKRLDPGVLVRDNSGSGECYGGLQEDFADFYDYHFYAEPERLALLMDAFAAPWRRPRPWLFGEFCDSDTFRSAAALRQELPEAETWWLDDQPSRYPLSVERELPLLDQERRLARAGLPWEAGELARRSHARSWLVRKQMLEGVRLYPQLSGYVITSLRDAPTVTSGMFDDLGRPKWPDDMRRVNAETVVLLARPPQRRWVAGGDRLMEGEAWSVWAGQRFRRSVVLSHFGRAPLTARVRWQVALDETVLAAGALPRVRLRPGQVAEIGALDFVAPDLPEPRRLVLRLWLEGAQAPVENDWRLWVVPGSTAPLPLRFRSRDSRLHALAEALSPPGASAGVEVTVADQLEQTLLREVRLGGQALVMQAGPGQLPTRLVPFWREGLPLLMPHPALTALPHDGYADMAWDSLACERVIVPDGLSRVLGEIDEYRPIVRRLDCRDFGVADYAAEARLGRGRLVLTTLSFARLAEPTWGWQGCPMAALVLSRVLAYLAGLLPKETR